MLKHHVAYLPGSCETYSEPFFGGGAMYLHVQKTLKPRKSFINDVNEGIVNIYRAIQKDAESFCQYVDEFEMKYLTYTKPDRKKYYYELRHAHAFDYTNWDEDYTAAVLYFLLKTGFNGVWQINKNTNNRYGTPSGLLNQKDRVYDKQMVREWHHLLQNTEIFCGDYTQCPPGGLNYLDPPYRVSYTTYGTNWDDAKTESLLKHCQTLPGAVLFCNRDDGSNFFETRKGSFNMVTFDVSYTVGRTGGIAAKEVLLYRN